jgi:Ca-activated chloride channel homolog
VPGLGLEDFVVYEDGRPVDITHFSAERVPVSLGIVLDTSGSMADDKIANARAAIERFLDRLNPGDEVFLYGFASGTGLIQDWTTDREAVTASLRRVRARGGTAMYDAVVRAVPMAQDGRHRKKVMVLISDGNDTNSVADIDDVRAVVRETEVLIYAVGIDGEARPTIRQRSPRRPPPFPFPLPGRGRPRMPWPMLSQLPPTMGRIGTGRLNVLALRQITDESGGRTEIVRSARDLEPATAGIAEELNRQYYLGYASAGERDGRWHEIRVEMRDGSLRVRARRGFTARSD